MRSDVRKMGFFLAVGLVLNACSPSSSSFRYTGRTDADTLTVSSQTTGTIQDLDIHEGDTVRKDQVLGAVDDSILLAQKRQQEAQFAGFDAQTKALDAQIQQSQAQLDLDRSTLAKTEKVLAEGGATRQTRDELATKVEVETKNAAGLEANLRLVHAQETELKARVQQVDLSIQDAQIISPIDGTILTKLHYTGEFASVGTPLLELADLTRLYVEIYVPLAKLPALKFGESAVVHVDGLAKGLVGRVSWVASEASFTPKTILTEETQTTLVYGVKVFVHNANGALKIGMPVEVSLP